MQNCFQEVKTEEKDWITLNFEGQIPKDISGQLIRIGSGQFEMGQSQLNHSGILKSEVLTLLLLFQLLLTIF